jgi:hypothetical protein
MPDWELIELAEPARIALRCELRLRSELKRLAGLTPCIVQLVHAEGDMLALALCGPWAMVYWADGPYILRNRILRPDTSLDDSADLLYRGYQLLLEPAALFALEDAIEVAAFVYNYRQLPIWVGACADAECRPFLAAFAPIAPRRRDSDEICVLRPSPSYAG